MSYKIDTISNFRKEAKQLSKKYPSLKTDLKELGIQLMEDPTLGTSLGIIVSKSEWPSLPRKRGNLEEQE